MKRIQDLVDKIDDEICGAKEYAEEYLTFKAKGNSTWSGRYKSMAEDELKHSMYIHDRTIEEINELKKVYTPPVEMEEKWNEAHKKYIERVAWIKQMLAM